MAGAEATMYTLGLLQTSMSQLYAEKLGSLASPIVRDTPSWEYLPNIHGDQSSPSKEDRPESFLTSPAARLGLSAVRIRDCQ